MLLRHSYRSVIAAAAMLVCIPNFEFIIASPSGQCSSLVNDEIQRCVQPVADYAKVLNREQEDASQKSAIEFGQAMQLPKLGGQVFRELCRLIRDFENCVSPYRTKCKKHITINLIASSYGYLCNQGYKTFMKSADCLMELDQRPAVKKCHDDTLSEIEKANNEPGISMPSKLERMCDALNSFSRCVMLPIAENCGVDSWKVIFRVLKDTTRTLMPACQFTENQLLAEFNATSDNILYATAQPINTSLLQSSTSFNEKKATFHPEAHLIIQPKSIVSKDEYYRKDSTIKNQRTAESVKEKPAKLQASKARNDKQRAKPSSSNRAVVKFYYLFSYATFALFLLYI
ncbi:hypothetical protein DdX_02029 [Ditylenchus destructor]|uniref:DUF19 domain-containing protein n=1 Tax=Ditylenchus destructor TaxID=166010 RepID=A0AAD4RBW3_9BILA|nr:hypothetical protein DdX_02029 [Ditylenchus destructor]